MNREIIQKTEKAYFESKMDSIFDIDECSHRRIAQQIGLIISRKDTEKQNKRYLFSNYYHGFAVIKIVFFYFVLGLIGQIFRLLQKSKQPDSKNSDIVTINAASGVNRFDGISETFLIDYKVAEVFIYNEDFFKHYKGRNRTFLYPRFINIKTMKSIINYLFNYRVAFYSNLVKYGVDLYTFREIDKYLIRQIIHYNWAEREAVALYCNYKESILFFDQDGDSKCLFLANHLNRKKAITIHIQHGIMTEPQYYIPICKYMFCCSEREKKLLIDEGVAANRLFVYGVPFQTLIRWDRLLDNSDIKVKILVLANSHFNINIAKENISLIKNSLILKGIEDKALRLRPGDRQIEKELWECGLHDYKIRKNTNIFEEIFNAEIVITFSYDVLIKCLYLKKKVIACLDMEQIRSKKYNFFYDIPFLHIATNSNSLDEQLKVLLDLDQKEYENEIDEESLEYNFGTQNIKKIKENIKSNIKLICNN